MGSSLLRTGSSLVPTRCVAFCGALNAAGRLRRNELHQVTEPELTWMAFTARYAERKLTMDWDRLWETYVVREKKWEKPESANRSPNGPTVASAVDLDAPWFRTGSESS
jgi:hypothetical protein